jgi:hypothetical protein
MNAINLIPLVQRALVTQLRGEMQGSTQSQKIAATQAVLYQASQLLGLPYTLLVPKVGFDEKIKRIFAIAKFLPIETLLDLAVEILEEPTDQNE